MFYITSYRITSYRIILATLIAAACGAASAQSMYKCTVNGKITYTGAPCTSGDMKVVDVPKMPKTDPVRAEEKLQREKSALARLEKARQERETKQLKATNDSSLASNDAKCTKRREELALALQNADRAPGFKRASMRESAAKMGEALQAECGS